MADTLTTTFNLYVRPLLTETSGFKFEPGISINTTLADGTSANQSDIVYAKTHSIVAASPTDLDLAGSLLMPNQAACVFVKVVLMCFRNNSTTATRNLLLGGGSNTFNTWLGAAGDIVKVGPGGVFLLYNPSDGYTVTASTGDILRLDMSAGTENIDVILVGRSA